MNNSLQKISHKILGLIFIGSLVFLGPTAIAEKVDFSKYNLDNWGIQDFHSDIVISPDSSITVTENITADFTQASGQHGMIREIPIRYQDGNKQNLNIRLNLISVKDENNQDIPSETKISGGNINLKIGSADQLVDGKIKKYQITYKLQRGLNQFKDHDELYWNITGNGFNTAILKASSTIRIPTGAKKENLKTVCYTGPVHSQEQNCQGLIIDNQTYQFNTNAILPRYSGLTTIIAFPKNLINYPSSTTYVIWFLEDNWGYLIPILILFILFYQWHRNGRDPKASRTAITPQYESPDNLPPAEIGTLIDDTVDMRDITSTIIDLATRGYLKIIETEKKNLIGKNYEYQLKKPDTPPKKDQLNTYEEKIYQSLFGDKQTINLNDLKYKFYKSLPAIRNAIYENLVEQKYYARSPDKVRGFYYKIGAYGLIAMILFLNFLAEINLSLFISIIISCLIIIAFGSIMPKKTQKGADTRIKILGLEEFIKTAEKDRLKFYEKENIFEKVLPHAIALGLADKWVKSCEGLFKEAPDWYQSNNPDLIGNFNSYNFLNTLNNFNQSIVNNMETAPRSAASGGSSGFGSGGFSGGGFGGGGGSNW